MALNFFDTHTLLASVREITPARSFLLDRYFPTNTASDVFTTTDVNTKRETRKPRRLFRQERTASQFFVTDTK